MSLIAIKKYFHENKGMILKKLLTHSKKGIVFAGHGVAKEFKDKNLECVHISYSNFKSIVNILTDLEFDFLSMDEVKEIIEKRRKPSRHWVHFTFDDGYQNNFDIIYPYLKERKIPFSMFVSTFNVQHGEFFPTFLLRSIVKNHKDLKGILESADLRKYKWTPENFENKVVATSIEEFDEVFEVLKNMIDPLEWEKLKQFYNDRPIEQKDLLKMAQDPLVHIGSHSHRHIAFHRRQNIHLLTVELKKSINYLQELLNLKYEPTFCYPNGDFSPKSIEICIQEKIPLSFVSESGFIDKHCVKDQIPRFWLSHKKRIYFICVLLLLGNPAVYIIRKVQSLLKRGS